MIFWMFRSSLDTLKTSWKFCIKGLPWISLQGGEGKMQDSSLISGILMCPKKFFSTERYAWSKTQMQQVFFAKVNEKFVFFCVKLVQFCDLRWCPARSKIQKQHVFFAKINETCFDFLCKARGVLRFKRAWRSVKNPETKGVYFAKINEKWFGFFLQSSLSSAI